MENGKRSAEKRMMHPAEMLFRRELDLLDDDEKIRRILNHFDLYAHDISDLNPDDIDNALLWLLELLMVTFLSRKQEGLGNAWELNVCIMNIYRYMKSMQAQHKKYLFPITKKLMLTTILSQWDVKNCDEHGQEIFLFIWDTYGQTRMKSLSQSIEERNTIDELLMKRLDGACSEDVEKWIMWIRSKEERDVRSMPDQLGRHFALARVRREGFHLAWWDTRINEIAKALGLRHVTDDMLPALRDVCFNQIKLDNAVGQNMDQLAGSLSLSPKEKITHHFRNSKHVEIRIFLDALQRTLVGSDWKTFLKEVENEMEKMLLISKSGVSLIFELQEFSAELFLCDLRGQEEGYKMWDKQIPF